MRIKRIEIIGFKSFHDKTVLNILEPVTAVVGPNGCGKSNIIDAIRWCMGEQSAKHLRGKAMDDVIFNGSETRAPAGMAEVSLTFEDVGLALASKDSTLELGVTAPDSPESRELDEDEAELEEPGEKPAFDFSQYGEVTVTRRLYRDGGSEYFINKTPCRLRDIVDFFLGTGVGTKAYSIIEQGRVGMIVSAKPEDRRLILEEAAGITKFKKKKLAAERKMEQTRANLVRVNDVVSEIEKQLASLRRQAQKAERYKKYRAELRDIEIWSAAHRYLGARAEDALHRGQLEALVAERAQVETAHEAADARVVAARAEGAVEERQLAELTQVLFDVENRLKLGESQVDFQGREAQDLEERAAAATGEVAGLRTQLDESRSEATRVAAEVERLGSEASTGAAELAGLDAELAAKKSALAGASSALDAARAEVARAQADIARHENNTRSLERRRADLELRAGRMAEEETRVSGRAAEIVDELGGHEARLGELRRVKVDHDQDRSALEARRLLLETQKDELEAEVKRVDTDLAKKRSRLASLVQIQNRFEGFARGTRALMKQQLAESRGMVADVLQVPADVERAVEAVLGDRLGAILVESPNGAAAGIAFLKKSNEGRSTFVPLTASAGAAGSPAADAPVPLLAARVTSAPEHRGIVDALLGDVGLVDTLEAALALHGEGVRQSLVTLDGDLIDAAGIVTGGSRETAGAGVLAQKREIRELEEACSRLAAEHETLAARQIAARAELKEAVATLETMRRDAHQSDLAILTSEKDLARWAAEAERLAERRAQLGRERGELEGTLGEHARETEENFIALGNARDRADDAEKRQLGLIDGVTQARGEVDDAGTRVTEHRVRVAQLDAQKIAVRAQLQRLEAGARDLAGRIERLERSAEDGTARAAGLRAEVERTSVELETLRSQRRERASELAAGRAAHELRLAILQDEEVALRSLRQRLERLGAETARLELKLSTLDADRRHLEETIAERHRVELRREIFEHHLRPPISEVEETRLRELRELIDRMGEINLTAIEEFDEQSKRYEFLATQKKDLESALEQLERAIAKINRVSRKRFRETFEAVNAKFKEVFPRLFRGGRAELRLVGGDSDEEILDAGVEILAQPPGKKNVTVELLSGGEKALTAVSLIFAIFLIKPSPFCILDEVDAPLDEANVGRYNDMVREMTDRSQFIVITHNKRTMEIADSLFGITMEEPGCSKLVGVNLRTFSGEKRAA